MNKDQYIHLGYTIPDGREVSIPLGHMIVVGQTQRSGKTTTLEALIARAPKDIRAVAFLTKRGESAFRDARTIPPYFSERADWQFVLAVLEATMRQRLNPHRSFIMKVTQGQTTLKGVQRQVQAKLRTAKGFAESIYTELNAYLELVIPQLDEIEFANKVVLKPGINVMDLAEYRPEVQALVIRSVLEWIYEKEKGVITIIPEAWEMIPEGRGSPVKLAAEMLIRKGAVLRNFVWMDSQDTAGTDKFALRACRTWLLGVQREINEIKRTLGSIPSGIHAPKAGQIAVLGIGQFYACYDNQVHLTYVQPAWMPAGQAKAIAAGVLSLGGTDKESDEWVSKTLHPDPDGKGMIREWVTENLGKPKQEEEMGKATQEYYSVVYPPVGDEIMDLNKLSDEELLALGDQVRELIHQRNRKTLGEEPKPTNGRVSDDIVAGHSASLYTMQGIYDYVIERAARNPKVLKLLDNRRVLEVEVIQETITSESDSLRGRVARLIVNGFFNEWTKGYAAVKELRERQKQPYAQASIYRELDDLTRMGFLVKNDEKAYRVVSEAKIHIRQG